MTNEYDPAELDRLRGEVTRLKELADAAADKQRSVSWKLQQAADKARETAASARFAFERAWEFKLLVDSGSPLRRGMKVWVKEGSEEHSNDYQFRNSYVEGSLLKLTAYFPKEKGVPAHWLAEVLFNPQTGLDRGGTGGIDEKWLEIAEDKPE